MELIFFTASFSSLWNCNEVVFIIITPCKTFILKYKIVFKFVPSTSTDENMLCSCSADNDLILPKLHYSSDVYKKSYFVLHFSQSGQIALIVHWNICICAQNHHWIFLASQNIYICVSSQRIAALKIIIKLVTDNFQVVMTLTQSSPRDFLLS